MRATILLLVVVAAWMSADAHAQITIPSDVGVTFTATPATNLTTGEPIDATLTVTNYGPDPLPAITLSSSTFVDEIYLLYDNVDECFLFATVVDAYPTAYYYWNWAVALPDGPPPLLPGETRTCHLTLTLTSTAPQTMPFSFGVNPYYTDPNPSNDTETIILKRPAAPIPALSPVMLLLLVILLVGAARRIDHRAEPIE